MWKNREKFDLNLLYFTLIYIFETKQLNRNTWFFHLSTLHYANIFLHNLTTSLAVLVNDLSSLLVNNFSDILRIYLELSGDGFKAFLFKLKAQYSDFIRFLQIEVFSDLNAGRIYWRCDSLMSRRSFFWMPWIMEKWMKARMFMAALSMIVWNIEMKG